MTQTVPGEFGAIAEGEGAHAALLETWRSSAAFADRAAAGVELCKLGDLGPRDELLAALVGGEVPDGMRVPLQQLVLSIVTAEQATSEALIGYASRIADEELLRFAASGRRVLARDAAPIYLGLAQAFEAERAQFFYAAADSGFELAGVDVDDLGEDATVQEWGDEVMSATADVDARYVLRGAPAHPASTVKELTATVMRSAEQGTTTDLATFAQLATWSGVPHPALPPRGASADDVRAATEYALTLSRLPWRPGAKYFYGHDVDGGPGLHDAAA